MPTSQLWRPWSPIHRPADLLSIAAAEGNRVRDSAGHWYLDGISGALNASCGHGHPRLIEAATRQLAELAHYDLMNATHPVAEQFAVRLAAALPPPLTHTLLLNSGSEATEAAIRMVLQYWRNIGKPRDRVITFEAGYHGSTALAQQLSGLPYARSEWAPPFPITKIPLPGSPRSLRGPAGADAFADAFAEALAAGPPAAAVMVEPLLNVAGGIVLPDGLLRRLRQLCDEHGTLLILDEVFCGFGRTGRLFGFEHDGITPDVVITSKGISGGYVPLAAVTTSTELHASFVEEPLLKGLRYGHTTGGHAVACAVGLAVLDVIAEEGLVGNAAARGRQLLDRLGGLLDRPGVADVRGRGLVVTVEADGFDIAAHAVATARRAGVLVRQQGINVMIIPPLTVTEEQTAEFGDAIMAAFAESEAATAAIGR